ncbi:MAG TPA: DUF2891 domain-containing protein [Kofleriaceae bacterium]|nr:DUF2891 domain-containing protein [Kofleriaceae bacterium]
MTDSLAALPVDRASQLARLPLAGIHREYPHKLDHLVEHAGELAAPRALHPAFYGCFDWHSAVHSHWALVTLVRAHPALPEAAAIRAALDRSLTAEHLAGELAYFRHPGRATFERTYGWAWLLELARALRVPGDADCARWAASVQPLADEIVARYLAFLPRLDHPIRTGVHANTAFGLALALDYARAAGERALAELICDRARAYYGADRDAPVGWEPGGEDFLSPSLVEADVMRRVLPREAFAPWLHGFFGAAPRWSPVSVRDRSDGKLAHLDGLNLSRAWCLRAIAAALPDGDPLAAPLAAAGELHARAGLGSVATGDYAGEHWLASFAVYLLATTSR